MSAGIKTLVPNVDGLIQSGWEEFGTGETFFPKLADSNDGTYIYTSFVASRVASFGVSTYSLAANERVRRFRLFTRARRAADGQPETHRYYANIGSTNVDVAPALGESNTLINATSPWGSPSSEISQSQVDAAAISLLSGPGLESIARAYLELDVRSRPLVTLHKVSDTSGGASTNVVSVRRPYIRAVRLYGYTGMSPETGRVRLVTYHSSVYGQVGFDALADVADAADDSGWTNFSLPVIASEHEQRVGTNLVNGSYRSFVILQTASNWHDGRWTNDYASEYTQFTVDAPVPSISGSVVSESSGGINAPEVTVRRPWFRFDYAYPTTGGQGYRRSVLYPSSVTGQPGFNPWEAEFLTQAAWDSGVVSLVLPQAGSVETQLPAVDDGTYTLYHRMWVDTGGTILYSEDVAGASYLSFVLDGPEGPAPAAYLYLPESKELRGRVVEYEAGSPSTIRVVEQQLKTPVLGGRDTVGWRSAFIEASTPPARVDLELGRPGSSSVDSSIPDETDDRWETLMSHGERWTSLRWVWTDDVYVEDAWVDVQDAGREDR